MSIKPSFKDLSALEILSLCALVFFMFMGSEFQGRLTFYEGKGEKGLLEMQLSNSRLGWQAGEGQRAVQDRAARNVIMK